MKGFYYLLIILLCLPLLLGMGAQGGTPLDKIPIPEKKFKAVFIDQSDVTTECINVSIEGSTALQGKIGEGIYTISFDNIREIVFRQKSEKLYGQLKMRDGSSMELNIGKDKKIFGQTPYGTYQIRINDLKKALIEPIPQKKN
jgi:hypothetical protein